MDERSFHGDVDPARVWTVIEGIGGRLYWLAVLPFHSLIFPAMSRNITAAAQKLASAEEVAGTP